MPNSYQLRKERRLFWFLCVLLILVQPVLQLEGQCVIVATDDIQYLEIWGNKLLIDCVTIVMITGRPPWWLSEWASEWVSEWVSHKHSDNHALTMCLRKILKRFSKTRTPLSTQEVPSSIMCSPDQEWERQCYWPSWRHQSWAQSGRQWTVCWTGLTWPCQQCHYSAGQRNSGWELQQIQTQSV